MRVEKTDSFADADGGLTSDDLAVLTECLNHFVKADPAIFVGRRNDSSRTNRTEVGIASQTSSNNPGYKTDATVDAAGQEPSKELNQAFRDRNNHSVSVEGIQKQSRYFFIAPEDKLNLGFGTAFPNAKAYVILSLPGYDEDQKQALVSFLFGPTGHGAQAFYKLKRTGGRWLIEWHKFNYYL